MWAAPGDGLNMRVLWTDMPYAHTRVAAMHDAGVITDGERGDLTHFIDHGWLIWSGVIDPALIDQFASDVRNHHAHPGKFLTTDHRNNGPGLKPSGRVPDRFESLFDLYVNLASSRDVCLHPRITRFLSLIFDAKPVAMQQLLFQRSNGHKSHQDTSVVAVQDPMLLAATWIALEDVQEGSGELAYYDRSHRLPHYLFASGSKFINWSVDDPAVYNRELEVACERQGMQYGRFLAKKGDIFFWTADLVHRSHPRTMPEDTSRLSCVTHYHPAYTRPYWFGFHPDRAFVRDHGPDFAYSSFHYNLSRRRSGFLTPYPP